VDLDVDGLDGERLGDVARSDALLEDPSPDALDASGVEVIEDRGLCSGRSDPSQALRARLAVRLVGLQ
jgi:hypothetical protein